MPGKICGTGALINLSFCVSGSWNKKSIEIASVGWKFNDNENNMKLYQQDNDNKNYNSQAKYAEIKFLQNQSFKK